MQKKPLPAETCILGQLHTSPSVLLHDSKEERWKEMRDWKWWSGERYKMEGGGAVFWESRAGGGERGASEIDRCRVVTRYGNSSP